MLGEASDQLGVPSAKGTYWCCSPSLGTTSQYWLAAVGGERSNSQHVRGPQGLITPTLETPARNQSTVSCSNKLCPDTPAMRLHGFRHESNALAVKSRNNRERCIPCYRASWAPCRPSR